MPVLTALLPAAGWALCERRSCYSSVYKHSPHGWAGAGQACSEGGEAGRAGELCQEPGSQQAPAGRGWGREGPTRGWSPLGAGKDVRRSARPAARRD